MKENSLLMITGATSGVGLSLARYLCRRFLILAIARNPERLKEEFDGKTGVIPVKMDLSDPEEVVKRMEELVARYSHIPFLINNAGVNIKAALGELSLAGVQESIQVNAISPTLILQKILPGMKEKNFGRVINVTSGAPFNCFPEYGAYSASKGALNAFTVTAAREYAKDNIKINLMSPGPVRSQMAPNAPMDPSVCHPTVDYLLDLDENGPTGRFFWLGYEIPLFPDLEGIQWLEGKAGERFRRVF
jgi:3-oxoacyl-[acyl-carrier protein] reductase